jgi:hypothetical protein
MTELHSKNLVPFKKRRGAYHIPGLSAVDEERPAQEVDRSLSSEEQSFVRHYLTYADMILKNDPVEDSTQSSEVSFSIGKKDSIERAA